MSVAIELTRGFVTIVDEVDADMVASFNWHAHDTGNATYARRCITRYRRQYLHRLLTDAPAGLVVDHVNGDTLDNRRSNLRVCEQVQNMWNMAAKPHTSQFRGVSWRASKQRWVAQIRVRGQTHFIGCFDDEEAAARAYDAVCAELRGPFAQLNFPVAHALPGNATFDICRVPAEILHGQVAPPSRSST